jgi:DNA end-binding protein Ku
MATRASWKGFLKVGELACHVGLYAAASTSERISFRTVNRATGNRVKREFVDRETGKPVTAEDQVKGYEVGKDEYVVLEPEEITAVVPASDKTLRVETFIACDDVDTVYFDRPYYLTPADSVATKPFTVIRDGLRKTETAALARTVLFRRLRTLMIRPYEAGLIANTLHFDYEIRAASAAFEDIPAVKTKGEMLDLAEHIIKTKSGTFDPKKFDDRYDQAVAALIKAKLEGKPIERAARKEPGKVIDLMEALRKSAGRKTGTSGKRAASKKRSAAARRRTPKRTQAAAKKRKAG